MSLKPCDLRNLEPVGSMEPVGWEVTEPIRTSQTATAPKVSVVMAVYDGNSNEEVAAAARSILQQSFPAFEFLILSDGITRPELLHTLCQLAAADRRIRLLTNAVNQGISRSLNILIHAARAKYVAIMDSDDLSTPERLNRQFDFLESQPHVDIVGCFATEINAAGATLFEKRLPTDGSAMSHFMCYRDPLVHPSVMYRKSLFDRIGYYSEARSDASFGDTDLWSRALLAGCGIANIPEPLYQFRRNESFLNRRRGWQFAWTELCHRARYIHRAGLPKRHLFWPLLVALARICPRPILHWAYHHCRGQADGPQSTSQR